MFPNGCSRASTIIFSFATSWPLSPTSVPQPLSPLSPPPPLLQLQNIPYLICNYFVTAYFFSTLLCQNCLTVEIWDKSTESLTVNISSSGKEKLHKTSANSVEVLLKLCKCCIETYLRFKYFSKYFPYPVYILRKIYIYILKVTTNFHLISFQFLEIYFNQNLFCEWAFCNLWKKIDLKVVAKYDSHYKRQILRLKI